MSFCRLWKHAGTSTRCQDEERLVVSVWLFLYGILGSLSSRDNNYQHSSGGRQAHSSNEELGDLHDQIEDADSVSARSESSSNSDEE